MIADHLTNTVYFSDLLPVRFPALAAELALMLKQAGIIVGYIQGTKDIWARDYMPIQVGPSRFIKFRYYPDYLRGTYESLITPPKVALSVPVIKECRQSRLIVDGGNIVRYGDTAIMTDKVFKENPQYTPKVLRAKLAELLEVENLIIIPKEPHEVFGHADGIVRFVNEQTVVVNDYSKVNHAYRGRLLHVLRREGLVAVEITYAPERTRRGVEQSAVGVYANFLQCRGVILVPVYGLRHDEAVVNMLCRTFRGVAVHAVGSASLSQAGGGLNCVGWSLKP